MYKNNRDIFIIELSDEELDLLNNGGIQEYIYKSFNEYDEYLTRNLLLTDAKSLYSYELQVRHNDTVCLSFSATTLNKKEKSVFISIYLLSLLHDFTLTDKNLCVELGNYKFNKPAIYKKICDVNVAGRVKCSTEYVEYVNTIKENKETEYIGYVPALTLRVNSYTNENNTDITWGCGVVDTLVVDYSLNYEGKYLEDIYNFIDRVSRVNKAVLLLNITEEELKDWKRLEAKNFEYLVGILDNLYMKDVNKVEVMFDLQNFTTLNTYDVLILNKNDRESHSMKFKDYLTHVFDKRR